MTGSGCAGGSKCRGVGRGGVKGQRGRVRIWRRGGWGRWAGNGQGSILEMHSSAVQGVDE